MKPIKIVPLTPRQFEFIYKAERHGWKWFANLRGCVYLRKRDAKSDKWFVIGF